jgi:hypothetical protein
LVNAFSSGYNPWLTISSLNATKMYYGREGRQSQMQPPPSSVKFQMNSLLGFGEVEFVFGE